MGGAHGDVRACKHSFPAGSSHGAPSIHQEMSPYTPSNPEERAAQPVWPLPLPLRFRTVDVVTLPWIFMLFTQFQNFTGLSSYYVIIFVVANSCIIFAIIFAKKTSEVGLGGALSSPLSSRRTSQSGTWRGALSLHCLRTTTAVKPEAISSRYLRGITYVQRYLRMISA